MLDDNLPVTEQDMRVLSVAAMPMATNPVVNGAIERLANAFVAAKNNGEKFITIPLDGRAVPIKETIELLIAGELA